MEGMNESRRGRKKRATRETIAAAARELFADQGFDAVTVAQIAVAADVAEKTVYNHFPTKEDLAFPERQQRLQALITRIAQRPPNASVLDVFRATTSETIDDLAAGRDRQTLAMQRIILRSETLQQRLSTGWEEEAKALASAIRGSAGSASDGIGPTAEDIVAAVVARTLLWTHRTILHAALSGLIAGENPKQLAARLQAAADRAYDQLARGLAQYGSNMRDR